MLEMQTEREESFVAVSSGVFAEKFWQQRLFDFWHRAEIVSHLMRRYLQVKLNWTPHPEQSLPGWDG